MALYACLLLPSLARLVLLDRERIEHLRMTLHVCRILRAYFFIHREHTEHRRMILHVRWYSDPFRNNILFGHLLCSSVFRLRLDISSNILLMGLSYQLDFRPYGIDHVHGLLGCNSRE